MRRPHQKAALDTAPLGAHTYPPWNRLGPRAAAAAGACLWCVAVAPSFAATLSTTFEAAAYHDARSLRALHPQGDLISLASPSVAVSLRPGAWIGQVSERMSFQSYAGTANPKRSAEDTRGALARRFSAGDSIAASYRVTHSSDPLELDQPGAFSVAQVTQSAGGASTSLGVLQASGSRADWAYEEPGRWAGQARLGEASVIALRTPATTAWLGAGASEYDIEGVSALRMLTAVAGIRRVHSRAWTSELELGAARVVRRGVGQPTLEPAARVGVTATRAREASDTELRLHLARDFATTGTVELAHRSGPHRLTAALDLALEAQGGVFTDVTHDRRLRVELQEALPARTVLSTGWSVGRAHTLGVGDVSATSGRAWVVATRKLMSAVEVGLGWQLIEQSTTQAGVHRGYRGARTTLSVAVVPR